MPTTLTTVVDITPQRISLEQDGQPAGTITTSIKKGRIAKNLKRFGVSAIVGMLGGVTLWRRKNNLPMKSLGLMTVFLMTIAFQGLSFYENNMFKVRYKYFTGLKSTSELVTSIFQRNKFKIRAFHGDGSEDYTVRYIDSQNFEIFDHIDEKIFTTVNNEYYSFSEVDEPEKIGNFLPLWKHARVKIEIKGNQMKNKSDIVVLAATLSYLHKKLRPVHLLGGLKLLGMAVPLGLLIRWWKNIEEDLHDTLRDHYCRQCRQVRPDSDPGFCQICSNPFFLNEIRSK